MARVTVEDCVQKVPNRFELVLLAAQRARNLSRGEELTLDRDNDKNPVVALREIADETIDSEQLEQDLVKSLSRAPEPEPADEEVLDLIPTDQNIFGLQDISAEEEAAACRRRPRNVRPTTSKRRSRRNSAAAAGKSAMTAGAADGWRAAPAAGPRSPRRRPPPVAPHPSSPPRSRPCRARKPGSRPPLPSASAHTTPRPIPA